MNTEIDTQTTATPSEPAKVDGRKHRKRRERKRRPAISEAMKRKWADPAYRAKQDAIFAQRRRNPVKSWSRRGVPDGMTKAEARVAWAEAHLKARAAMLHLIRNGQIDGMDEKAAQRLEAWWAAEISSGQPLWRFDVFP
jgi:hypothetical protein